jgi:hypothetical protein
MMKILDHDVVRLKAQGMTMDYIGDLSTPYAAGPKTNVFITSWGEHEWSACIEYRDAMGGCYMPPNVMSSADNAMVWAMRKITKHRREVASGKSRSF